MNLIIILILAFLVFNLSFRFFDVYYHYVQTRLQAQAAGVPYHYQGLCHMACFDTNTVCLLLVL